MNTSVEELLRDGMERFTEEVRAPAGLARAAGRRHRRRRALRAATVVVACGTAAVTAAVAVTAGTGTAGRPGASAAQARTVGYVMKRVENALKTENLVMQGNTTSSLALSGHPAANAGASVTFAYRDRNRYEEFSTGRRRYLAAGTGLIHGKLTAVYVTYFDRKWSQSPLVPPPKNACSTTGAISMGGPPIPTGNWPAFIAGSLACGAATVTGHAWIGGIKTTVITGSPVTVRLPAGQARAVREARARVRWSLYVNPSTYLPVRMTGSTQAFGGKSGATLYSAVTTMHWLPPTPANAARALVRIPAGFHQVSSVASQ